MDSKSYIVVIPVYNRGDRIERCVKSICEAARYTNNQVSIVIVDDGSKDDSLAKCNEVSFNYSMNNVSIFVVPKKNGSCSQARLTGMIYASEHDLGNYVIHIDSDDFVLDCMFKELDEVIDRHKDIDVIITNLICYDLGIYNTYVYLPYREPKIINKRYNSSINEVRDIANPVTAKVVKLDLWRKCFNNLGNVYVNLGEDLILTSVLFGFTESMVYTDVAYYIYEVANADSIVKQTDYEKATPKDLRYARNHAILTGI